MPWLNAGDFLKKFRNLQPPKEVVLSEAMKEIEEIGGVILAKDEIEFFNGILRIKNQASSVKSQIFINKEAILKSFKQKNIPVRDIRF